MLLLQEHAQDTDDALARAETLVRSGRVAQGLALARDWRPVLARRGDTQALAQCERIVCTAHQLAGRFRDSVDAGYRAIALYQRVDDVEGLVRVLGLQAIGLVRVGEVADALHLAARAIETMQQVPDPVRRAALGTRTWNNVSVVYEALGDIDKAVEAISAALGFAEQSGDPVMLAISTCNHWLYQLARLRGLGVRAGDPERTAVQRGLRQHFEACELAGHDTLVAGMAEALAEALMDEDRDDEARATVRQGVGAAARAGLGPEQARLELRMAELERRAGAVRRASAHMASALELALQADDKELLARCHLENSYLQEAQSRWRAALDSSRRHAEVLQTLLQARAARGAVEQAALLETERRRWCPR